MSSATKVPTITYLVQRDEASRAIPAPTYAQALGEVLVRAAERGRMLEHYALVVEHPSRPSTYTLFRLGCGRPLRQALLVGKERVEEYLASQIASALAEFGDDHDAARAVVGDLRWLRATLRDRPEEFGPSEREEGR